MRSKSLGWMYLLPKGPRNVSANTKYSLAVLLDEKRLRAIKGTPLEGKITPMFGGAIQALIMQVPADLGKKIVDEFSSARIDARGFIEEVPVAFKKSLFEEIVRFKSIEPDVVKAVMSKLPQIKAEAVKEEEYLPPPEL